RWRAWPCRKSWKAMLKQRNLARLEWQYKGGGIAQGRSIILRFASQLRIGAIVDGNGVSWPEQVARGKRGILRIHGEMPADGNQHQVRLIVIPDQPHIAEQAGVAHVINAKTIF